MMQADMFYQTSADQVYPLATLSADNLGHLPMDEKRYLSSHGFKGNLGDVCVVCAVNGAIEKVYIGIEQANDVLAIAHAVMALPSGIYEPKMTLSYEAQVMWSLAQYVFDAYKPFNNDIRVLLLAAKDKPIVLAEASAIFLTRSLINQPANVMHPEQLASVVKDLAKEYGAVIEEWVGDELLTHKFPAVHAVGRAAHVAPRLIKLTWGEPQHPRVTLVGKGVCFDSGGLDLKSSSTMRLMKKDMGGAAIVIGLAKWLMARSLPICLTVLVPAVENAVGERSYRPGDVLSMRNDMTVEIDNTDAEGRLILADALVKACEDSPELLIDFSTLTGAARTAVGTEISAYFTNDEKISQELMTVSQQTRDPVWRLPLFDPYFEMLQSQVADMTNSTGSAYAGAITAALFLKQFITSDTRWVHFDTMAWNMRSKPGKPEGGEAMGLQTVAHYLLQRYGAS